MLNLIYLSGRPWAVTPEIAELGARILGSDGHAALRAVAELHAAMRPDRPEGGRVAPGPRAIGGNVAVIPVLGLLTQRGGVINSVETTSTAALAQHARTTAADESVQAVVLELDSPGGEVFGGPEAAAALRDLAAVKPVVTSVNSLAGSLGYWLAAQATEVLVTPSGLAGSVGVYSAHEDRSKELETMGRNVTLIHAGRYKVEGNPFQPLDSEALQARQAEVNRYYDMFVRDLARGRGVSVDHVRSGFGEGRTMGAKAAVDAGMADAVGTFDDAVRRAAALARERRRGMTALAEAQVARARLG